MRDREKYGVEKSGLENAGPNRRGRKRMMFLFMEREMDKYKGIMYI